MKKFPKINLTFLRKLPDREKRITFSTVLTLIRVFFTPFIVSSMIYGHWGMAFFLFLFAALSDTIDGTLARIRNEQTFLGACLDPIADKILLLSIFFTLAFVDTPLFTIPLWFVLLILIKEVLQIAGAIILYVQRGHITIRSTWLGKLTMFMQVIFVIWLFACYFFHWVPIKTYYTMLGFLMMLVITSLIHYASIGLKNT